MSGQKKLGDSVRGSEGIVDYNGSRFRSYSCGWGVGESHGFVRRECERHQGGNEDD